MKEESEVTESWITYSWAILIILVIVGALAYFGVLKPNSWPQDNGEDNVHMSVVDKELYLEYENFVLSQKIELLKQDLKAEINNMSYTYVELPNSTWFARLEYDSRYWDEPEVRKLAYGLELSEVK